MKTLSILTCLFGVLAATAAVAQEPAFTHERPASQIVIEGAYVVPAGDLAADFPWAERGFGALPGLEAGFRWRYFLTPSLSISPAFHFANFGARTGEHGEAGDYSIQCTSYRYTLELMILKPAPERRLRPFLGLAWGLYRDRVEGYQQDFVKTFDSSVNTLGWTFRAGVRVVGLEISMLYSLNRFHTWQFYDTGYEEFYIWDNWGLRLGWCLPFSG